MDWFSDVSSNTHSSSDSDIEAPGAHLKSAFDYAQQEKYDVVVHWSQTHENMDSAVEKLLIALESNSEAEGAFVPFKGWKIQLFSYLISWVSGHPFKGWFAIARAYRTQALSRIAYELNTYENHFEVEVVLQLLSQQTQIIAADSVVSPIPFDLSLSLYFQCLKAAVKYRLQSVNLFYDFRFHPEQLSLQGSLPTSPYRQKFDADSPHRRVCDDPQLIPPGSRVLDIGCATGYVARRLVSEKGCTVVGIDMLPPTAVKADAFTYYQMDLENEADRVIELLNQESFDVILMLDVLEHLALPELFLLQLYRCPAIRDSLLIISTGNVAFIVVRLMLMLGYFNYGNRGILDVTHKRLFSVRTFKNLLDQTGFMVQKKYYCPVPFGELGFSLTACRWLERLNRFFMRLRPSLFAYQMLFVARSTKRFQHKGPQVSQADSRRLATMASRE